MTNGDRIRQMSNEELAEGMINADFTYCDWCMYECGEGDCLNRSCKNAIKAYLDMEVEE